MSASDKKDLVVDNATLNVIFDILFLGLAVSALFMFTQTGQIFALIGYIALFFVVIHAIIVGSGHFGTYVSRTLLKKPPFDNPLTEGKNKKKFTSQCWQLFIHISMGLFSHYILMGEDWVERPWHAAPWAKLEGKEEKPIIFALYNVQLAIWLVTCFHHRFVDERNKDYYVLFGHHLATIAVVCISYWFKYVRYGLLVFYFHDVSDVVLDLAKVANYLKLEGKAGLFITEILYGVLVSSWVKYRLYEFPRLIWYGIIKIIPVDSILPDGSSSFGASTYEKFPNHYFWDCQIGGPVCSVLLIILFCMHIFWGYLLLRIGYRTLFKKEGIHEVEQEEYAGEKKNKKRDSNKKKNK